MLSFVVSEALVDLRRAGRVGVSAILLITLSLTALGGFWLLSLNLGRAVGQWRDRVRVVVFLREEPSTATLAEITRRVEALDGVQRVRYVGKAEALRSLRQSLGAQGSVVDHLPRNPLPASLEVTPAEGYTTPEETRALAGRLAAFPEAEEVQGGAEWVEGLARWQHLFQVVGLAVGAVLALAAILTVTTATTLVLHARRAETEIMRLVGASEAVIRLPLLLQDEAEIGPSRRMFGVEFDRLRQATRRLVPGLRFDRQPAEQELRLRRARIAFREAAQDGARAVEVFCSTW